MTAQLRSIPEISVDRADGRPRRRVPISGRLTVGRDEDCDVSLPDRLLSRRHAVIEQRGEVTYLVDLGSTNGTFLNGRRMQGEVALHDGDRIGVGTSAITFHESAALAADVSVDDQSAVVESVVPEMTSRTTKKAIDVTTLIHEDRGLGVLCRATTALSAYLEPSQLPGRILDVLLEAIPAQRGAIMLLEGNPATPVLRATRSRRGAGIPGVSPRIAKRVIEGRVAILLRDPSDSDEMQERAELGVPAGHWVMCAPLWAATGGASGQGQVVGLVYLDSLEDEPPLTYTDLQVLTVLSSIAATKIESARLLEENLERRRLDEDIRLAAEIQSSLLPLPGPLAAGYDVKGSTRPCRTVGGDYFDILQENGQIHFALADVSGKGIGAAMLMVALRATVRAHWRDGSLAEATGRMNRTFYQNIPCDKYATFFGGRLDVRTGTLTYVNAGQNRPLLVYPDGHHEALRHGNTILGAFPDTVFDEATVLLEPDSWLIVFSDGVSDAWPDPDMADQALVEAVGRSPGADAETIVEAILHEVNEVSGSRPPDDRTILVVRRLPLPA